MLQQEKIYKDSGFKDPPGVEAETLLPLGGEELSCWWASIQTIAENDRNLIDPRGAHHREGNLGRFGTASQGNASMIAVTDKLLAEMVEAIVREVDPEQIYLFGSHARGDAREDSDVDLLIVEREPFGSGHSRFQEINRIYWILSSFRVPINILVYSSDEFAKWHHSLNHVVGRYDREGKLLYARS
jgi:predicted nucleotidyltransferase